MTKVFDLEKVRKEFVNTSANAVIIQVIYPSLLLYLQQKFPEQSELEKQLINLGEELANVYIDDGNIFRKTINFKKFIQRIYRRLLYNNNVKIKKIDKDTYHIKDPQCILCAKTEIEGFMVPVCMPFSGFFTKILNEFIDKEKSGIQEYRVHTLKSKWQGSKYCIHELKLVRGD